MCRAYSSQSGMPPGWGLSEESLLLVPYQKLIFKRFIHKVLLSLIQSKELLSMTTF